MSPWDTCTLSAGLSGISACAGAERLGGVFRFGAMATLMKLGAGRPSEPEFHARQGRYSPGRPFQEEMFRGFTALITIGVIVSRAISLLG